MKTSFIFLAALLASSPTISAVYSVHCPIDCPSSPDKNILTDAHAFVISQDTSTKMSDWIVYEVCVVNFGALPGCNWGNNSLISKDSRF